MAETATQANNKAVVYRGKGEREMTRIPKHVRKLAKSGAISEAQIRKMSGAK